MYINMREFTFKKDFKSNKEKERIKIRIENNLL
jgi:hypothetical protein